MNKKEVLEIRKQFTPERCAINRIAGCYVDGDKNIRLMMKEPFGKIPEEESIKYMEIFKKTLSGKVGKTLLNMDFPIEAEKSGGSQDILLHLRDSGLRDDDLLEEFFGSIIEHYNYGENFYIILIHASYDVPGKSTDNTEMFDASEDVYDFILCSICPVQLSKPGLSYDKNQNLMTERTRDRVVDMPLHGFLFPAFNDRGADIHGMLYYTKKENDIQPDFVDSVFGCKVPQTQKTQKEVFNVLTADVLGEDVNFGTVREIHEKLEEIYEENADNPDPVVLGSSEVKKIFKESGVPDHKLKNFEDKFTAAVGDKESILLDNVAGEKNITVSTPDVTIKVNPERLDLIETGIIDGRTCLVIPADCGVELNGLEVKLYPQFSSDFLVTDPKGHPSMSVKEGYEIKGLELGTETAWSPFGDGHLVQGDQESSET